VGYGEDAYLILCAGCTGYIPVALAVVADLPLSAALRCHPFGTGKELVDDGFIGGESLGLFEFFEHLSAIG
jgi:hypothetical protein